ncbi:hypothetical protein [Actinoplanes sp. NPDC020271]|uniref:hypothetical protein n=1 Tax=Actinoplanes sp. NPDC020271 TaxID=3363896 RepID=UPI0037AE22E3
MDSTGGHHVARIDDTVTAATLHERAEAVAVPDFNYLEQTVEAIAAGLTGRRARARGTDRPAEAGR